MNQSFRYRASDSPGYTLLELLVSFVVIMVLVAMAIPSVTRAWRTYQLNRAAAQVVGMIRTTRSDAVRRNTKIPCLIQPDGNGIWWIGEDVNGNGTLDPTEPRTPLPGGATFLPAGVAPDPSSMGYSTPPVVPGGPISFDARGGVDFGSGAPVVYVLFIDLNGDAASGYRAITVVPAGSTQVWLAVPGGGWVKVS